MFHGLNATQDQFRQVISKLGGMPCSQGYDVEEVGDSIGGGSAFAGGNLLHDGTVLLLPSGGNNFYIYDPSSKTTLQICQKPEANAMYSGGVLLRDGNVLCIPGRAKYCCLYDAKGKTARVVGSIVNPGLTADYFLGGTLLKDGRVLLVPFNAGKCWIYDPRTETTEALPNYISGSAFIGCQLLSDGRVLLVPRAYRCAMIYDPYNDLFSESAVCSGYACGALLPSGDVFFPFYFSQSSAVINTAQRTATQTGTLAAGATPYSFGTATFGDGSICIVPRNCTCARVYDIRNETMVDIPQATGGNDAYFGGISLPDGSALFVPKNKLKCLRVSPRGISPLPKETCLSPYLNKF